jgi:dihydrolipoamide dehydrogenase
LSFALLGIFPLVAKKGVAIVKARKVLANYSRPQKFDYNLVVIGAGSAGLVTSYIAAAVRAKVALIEKHKMGGDCLYTGCVPSKALLRSAKMLSYARRHADFGFKRGDIEFDFADVMERVQSIIKKVEPHDSVERYTELGVDCIQGEAKITSPYTVEVNDRVLTARNIVVATGARPFVPPIAGLDKISYLTSDNVWQIRTLPRRLVILGGGPIGCELSQAFARFGSQVTQVEMAPRILLREDEEISELVKTKFEQEGVRVLTGHRAKEVRVDGGQKILICDNDGQDVPIEFDEILVAVGRVANTKGFGLEELGVEIARNGTIETDEFLRTNYPNIFCAGDVAGPYQFTHTAAHQAWYASVNALFGGFKSFRTDYRVIPWATYTDPEVARVGINELEARENGVDYEVTTYGMDDLDRAIADSEDHGLVKVLTKPGSDKILGVTIAGSHASDIIAEYILAMKHGLGLNKILGTIHIYPTLAEANKFAAGQWKKAHAPEKILGWMERYHGWRRG